MAAKVFNDAPLTLQVDYWRKHQRHPKLLIVGLVKPLEYWHVQGLVNGGPETWRTEWEYLDEVNYERDDGVKERALKMLPEPVKEELLAPWREHFSWAAKEPATWVLGMACSMTGSFFRLMKEGLDVAAVTMASDDNATKPSRRCPWLLNLLRFLFEDAQLTTLLHHATQSHQPSSLRHLALRWICPLVPQNEGLASWLGSFAEDPDPLVRYWAAFRFCTLGWTSASPPSPPPFWLLDALSFGFSNPVLLDDYSVEEEEHRMVSICALESLGLTAMQRMVASLENRETQDAYVWWYLLNFIYLQNPDELSMLRDRWKRELSITSHKVLQRFLILLHAVSTAYAMLDPSGHGDAPAVSNDASQVMAFRYRDDAFLLRHALAGPRSCLRTHARLWSELQRQEGHVAADRDRLARVRNLLESTVPTPEEPRTIEKALLSTIPFAIADYILQAETPFERPGYEISIGRMTS